MFGELLVIRSFVELGKLLCQLDLGWLRVSTWDRFPSSAVHSHMDPTGREGASTWIPEGQCKRWLQSHGSRICSGQDHWVFSHGSRSVWVGHVRSSPWVSGILGAMREGV